MSEIIEQAVEAYRRGFQPIPVNVATRSPRGSGWTAKVWESEDQVRREFEEAEAQGYRAIGLILGKASSGLIDVDLDSSWAVKLRDYFLPKTAMMSGRGDRPGSHCWYLADDPKNIPSTRKYHRPLIGPKDPEKKMSVEFRTSGTQTIIPPSEHHSGDHYQWYGEPWGGEEGPAVVNAEILSVQVALLGLASVLLAKWPAEGGRHEAYLALAGALLRYGDQVHEYWERNLPVLITALAAATGDDDGPESRVAEVLYSTARKIRNGERVAGWPSLAEIIGEDHVEMARRHSKEVESLSGFVPEEVKPLDPDWATDTKEGSVVSGESSDGEELSETEEDYVPSWGAIDADPYLTGKIVQPEPAVLRRIDGQAIFYPGRVNGVFGKSESAKSWLMLGMCVQEMVAGARTLYIDLEDEPVGTFARLKALGADEDYIRSQFRYIQPLEPLADMQKGKYGNRPSNVGSLNHQVFWQLLKDYDPTLIVVDGMTALYGQHGLDTNDAMSTDVITTWLKSLTRSGRTTVVVIDHTGKGDNVNASPIGAHHKTAMIQGAQIRADAVIRPMRGAVGKVDLVVYKDRPGAVRAIATQDMEQVVGTVVLDSTQEDVTTLVIEPPNPSEVLVAGTPELEKKLEGIAEADKVLDRVLALFEVAPEWNTKDAAKKTGLAASTIRNAWDRLSIDGKVTREGSTRWTTYRLRS